MKAPFPYFGGKSKVAAAVWQRFGDVRNYVEPFCGSAAVLLGRPHYPFASSRTETINDADCFLANFWRALKAEPEEVSRHADWPVNEADLHARHLWLVNIGREHVERLRTDPDYYDAKIAGWWVWGLCQWIGHGWCSHPEHQKRPHLGDAGRGVHRPSQSLPHLHSPRGVHRRSNARTQDLHDYLAALAERFRYVRVCCGDWRRVCGPTPTTHMGLTGMFLDPPYSAKAGREPKLYACEDLSVAHAVRDWAVEHGNDSRLRIALCGYEGEHDMPGDWECMPWKANGGYASQRKNTKNNGRANARRERIWFSPHCLKLEEANGLFAGMR